jgi:hypothetical protein
VTGLLLGLALLMPQPWGQLAKGDKIVILGVPLSGKSTLAEKIVAGAWRVVWFDPAGDYGKPGRLSLSPAELERWPRLLDDDHARIVINPKGETDRELGDEFLAVTNLVRKAGDKQGLIFVADEVGDYRAGAEGRINWLFRRGRHHGIVPILVSQVATDIPLKSRKLASQVYCLQQDHVDELKELARVYGDDYAHRVQAWRKYDPPVVWSNS